MAYLPDSLYPLERTEFPKALSKDLYTGVRMVHEKFGRFYPTIEYHALQTATAPTVDVNVPASERSMPNMERSGGPLTPSPDYAAIDLGFELESRWIVNYDPITQFDLLWGEAIDERMQDVDEGWQQPHGNDDFEAVRSEVEKFKGPYYPHAQVKRSPKEQELKKLGFDEVRDLLVYIPLSMLDRDGIVVEQGDWFVWDDTRYRVLQFTKTGWVRNTNVRLFMALNCETQREGS